MTSWNLKELRELAEPILSENGQYEAILFMDSFDWKNKATYYHLFQAEEAVKKYLNDEGKNLADIMHLLFSSDSSSEYFQRAQKIREFSLVAATTTVHTLPEVLAQLVDLLIVRGERDVHNVSLRKTLNKLPDNHFKDEYESLISSNNYK